MIEGVCRLTRLKCGTYQLSYMKNNTEKLSYMKCLPRGIFNNMARSGETTAQARL